jgi:ParB-like chromosome segregation protein Spo0J
MPKRVAHGWHFVDIELCYVPPGRRICYNRDCERNQALIGSIREIGSLTCPLQVRRVGNHYEVVYGRRRLWAANEIGLRKVPVSDRDWSDREIAAVDAEPNGTRHKLANLLAHGTWPRHRFRGFCRKFHARAINQGEG